ncbi:MAG: hypothetical protein ACO1QS_01005 [Verrucomicrobiota bacterium]
MTLSLRVFASIVGSQTEINAAFDGPPIDVDIVIITVKDDYDPRTLLEEEHLPEEFERNVRTIGIRRDLPLVRRVCAKLHGYRKRVVVITNPVDIFTVLVKELLPSAEVYGLGVTVDAARLAFTAQSSGIKCKATDCPLGGVHIGRLVQLRSLWNHMSPISNQSDLAVDDLLDSASKIGPSIVRGLGFTLHDCAAVFAQDLAWFAGKDANRRFLCVSVGDEHSAVARPIGHSTISESYKSFDGLSENESKQLDSASYIVNRAVELIRRNPIFRHKMQ